MYTWSVAHMCKKMSFFSATYPTCTLQWRHNGRDGVPNHQLHYCLLNRSFRRRSKKTSKLRVTGLCAGNSPGTSEFPAEKASNAETVSIWWRHHESKILGICLQARSASYFSAFRSFQMLRGPFFQIKLHLPSSVLHSGFYSSPLRQTELGKFHRSDRHS